MARFKTILLAVLTLLTLALPSAASPPKAIASANDIELVAHTGGIVTGLAVQGGYAYVGISTELAVLDMADPSHPSRVASVALPWRALAVAVDGRYAYVLTIENGPLSGLTIVDISDPTTPRAIVSISIKANNIVVAGRYLYALSDDLHIYDLGNLAAPIQVGYSPLGGGNLALVGRYLYIGFSASNVAGLRILDVSNSAAPALIGEFATPIAPPTALAPAVSDLIVDRNHAYLSFSCCVSPPSGFVVDVSNPARPRRTGSLPGAATSIAVAGPYLYMADRNILRIVDISRPDRPNQLIAYTMPRGFYAQAIGPPTLKLAGRYLYYAAEDALEVVDISHPGAPTIPGAYITLTYAGSAAVAGRYAYLNASYGGLQILDLAKPANPIRVGWLPGFVDQVAIAGHYAYLATPSGPAGIQVVDVSAPANPVVVGRLAYSQPNASVPSMIVAGSYLYVADYYNGLRIIDISIPADPAEVDLLPGGAYSVAIGGHYAYVGFQFPVAPELQILDISNPAAPAKVGSFPIYASGVAVAGRYAYIASDVFRVLDISDPTEPVQVGALASNGSSVAVAGRYAYASDGLSLTVIDIANPTQPADAGLYTLPFCGGCSSVPSMLTFADGYAYLAQGDGGLFTFRFGRSISGRITHANGLPMPLAGVTLAAGAGLTATTDLAGIYTIGNFPSGTHTLAPAIAGYHFWPASRDITASSDMRGQDFVALTGPVSIALAPGAAASLRSSDTQDLPTRLDLPASAVAANTTLVLTPTIAMAPHGWAFAGHAFDLGASQAGAAVPDLAFGAPVAVTISYSAGDARLIADPSRLAMWWWNGTAWQDAAETCSSTATFARDPFARTIGVAICRTGRFALFGPTQQVYLPLSAGSTP
jgi:hypothetical protein